MDLRLQLMPILQLMQYGGHRLFAYLGVFHVRFVTQMFTSKDAKSKMDQGIVFNRDWKLLFLLQSSSFAGRQNKRLRIFRDFENFEKIDI